MKLIRQKLGDLGKKHPPLTRLYKNAAILFGGNALSAFLGLVCMAVLTRALGVEVFGRYALITAYIALIDRLVSFQTWQALIHYGTKAIKENALERLGALFFFGFSLDLLSALLGAILAVGGILLIPEAFGLQQIEPQVIIMMVLVLLFNWVSTPTAILRIFDKFYFQAMYLNIASIMRLAGYTFLWLSGSKALFLYIAVWSISTIIGRLFLFLMSLREATKNHILLFSRPAAFKNLFQEAPGLWKFVLTTNLDGIVRIIRDADIFVVNALLGVSATALYKIARDLARIPTQFTGSFYQAIYPELAKMASHNDTDGFRNLIRQSSLTLGVFVFLGWLVFAMFGKSLIGIFFGQSYEASYDAAFWCVAAIVIWAFAQPLSPAMMALGKVQTNLYIHFITTLVYIAMLWILSGLMGLSGAGIAIFIFYGIWSASMLFFLTLNLERFSYSEH